MAGRLERLVHWLTEPLEKRDFTLDASSYYPDIDAQLYARQQALTGSVPGVTIREALGIPAVFRAVSLLATAAASFNLREYVNQREIVPAAPVVRRPQPEWTPGAFTRDTVHYMASRGEAAWLVLERDFAGFASSILPVPPETIQSEWDGLRFTRLWTHDRDGKERDLDPRDVVLIPYMRDSQTGRGKGPLQMCGIALNVAHEAETWASRWFVGAIPSIYLDSKIPLAGGTEDHPGDAEMIKDKWLNDPPNVPKVGYGLTPTTLNINPESAQLTTSRMMSRGDAAVMFGIPGRLLEYSESGSSLTYANVGDLATELVRLTLAPIYLEQIEQAFSDLRPRGTEVRYDVEGFERADPKTRYEIHEKAIALGVYTPEDAARKEGEQPGSAEVVPAPLRRVV